MSCDFKETEAGAERGHKHGHNCPRLLSHVLTTLLERILSPVTGDCHNLLKLENTRAISGLKMQKTCRIDTDLRKVVGQATQSVAVVTIKEKLATFFDALLRPQVTQ